jgi:hypothetical protein
MARKTVKVGIDRGKPDSFISQAEKVGKKHESMGADSPLNSFNMALYNEKLDRAKQLRDESKDAKAISESKMEESKINLGIAIGQNRDSADTIYNMLLKMRNQLLIHYQGNEEKLSEWGFDVVVNRAKSRKKAS